MDETLLALTSEELEARVVALGGRPFHARIARREVFTRGILDYEDMTGLPARLRESLAAELPVLSGVERDRTVSSDRTTKLLVRFPAREARAEVSVETVHIPPRRAHQGRDDPRGATLCVSSQAGCPVGCPFCASGLAGLSRNLEPAEILEQFVRGRALGPLSRCVVMGIGEPLLNYPALRAALDVVRAEMDLSRRRITVSTVGFPERLRRIARDEPPFQLAISLHTPDDDQRDELVPAMRGVPIEDVLSAGDDWFATTGREVTYEYVLLGGENDSADHADRLASRLRGRRATVNLIPYNPTPELPFRRPAPEAVTQFHDRLREAGIVATVRWSRGLDGDAACGQLRLRDVRGPGAAQNRQV